MGHQLQTERKEPLYLFLLEIFLEPVLKTYRSEVIALEISLSPLGWCFSKKDPQFLDRSVPSVPWHTSHSTTCTTACPSEWERVIGNSQNKVRILANLRSNNEEQKEERPLEGQSPVTEETRGSFQRQPWLPTKLSTVNNCYLEMPSRRVSPTVSPSKHETLPNSLGLPRRQPCLPHSRPQQSECCRRRKGRKKKYREGKQSPNWSPENAGRPNTLGSESLNLSAGLA